MANADAAMAALLMEDEAEKATKSKKGAAQCGQDAGARTLERSTSGKRIMTINNVDRDEILFVSHRWEVRRLSDAATLCCCCPSLLLLLSA